MSGVSSELCGVKSLYQVCTELLLKCISLRNVLNLLDFSHVLQEEGDGGLKQTCVMFLVNTFDAVKDAEGPASIKRALKDDAL